MYKLNKLQLYSRQNFSIIFQFFSGPHIAYKYNRFKINKKQGAGKMKKTTKKIWIIDSTLRDGEQAPGIVFSNEQKLALSRMLVSAGVDELEAGIPAMGENEQNCIKMIKNANPKTRITCWCRAVLSDIELARKCKTGSIHISLPVSMIHMKTLRMDNDRVLALMKKCIESARPDFDYVSIGAQDASRAEHGFLKEFVFLAQKFGADRVRIADTVGIATPEQVRHIIKDIKKDIDNIELEFHAHNDLGMATANAVTAAQAGADALSVTVNGIGERAGNAPLEEVCTALRFAAKQSCNTKTSHLKSLSDFVAQASNRPIPVDKPITGKAVFEHESGIHCHALLKDPKTYEPFPAKAVGRKERNFTLGKHSGTGIISHILEKLGIYISRTQAESLLKHVRTTAIKKGKSISSEELIAMYWQMHSQGICG